MTDIKEKREIDELRLANKQVMEGAKMLMKGNEKASRSKKRSSSSSSSRLKK